MSAALRRIGRDCITEEHFTAEIARQLGLPALSRQAGETDKRYLIRRLDQLKWVNRHWAHADLDALPSALLEVAATQICHAAADYCQDRNAERSYKEGTFYPPKVAL